MNDFTAVSIAEGFCGGENAAIEEQREAWQYLVDTGLAWRLQGWFGRTAQSLIDAGEIAAPGNVAPDADAKGLDSSDIGYFTGDRKR